MPEGATLAQFALRWILMHDAVSTIIPGARSPDQARANAAAADLPALDDAALARVAPCTSATSRRTSTSAGDQPGGLRPRGSAHRPATATSP